MSLRRMSRDDLAATAKVLATSYNLVSYQDNFYIPTNHELKQFGIPGAQATWELTPPKRLFRFANQYGNILFETNAQKQSFLIMLEQFSTPEHEQVNDVLVRSNGKIAKLDGTKVSDPTGEFVANHIDYEISTNADDIKWVFDRIAEWVDSVDDAHSLLHHFATVLSPDFSAGKLVLLLGSGSNGKSTLLKMVQKLIGRNNISRVTRQMMAERSPAVHEVNGRLLNLVFDADRSYLKDSSAEKTLIVGEPYPVRMLYSSDLIDAQSNCLFVEGLNSEPKTGDKSYALQRRISRFWFPNTYAADDAFERRCLSTEMISALLALLIEHYVHPDDKALKLLSTNKSAELMVDFNLLNSPVHQYVEHLSKIDPDWLDKLSVRTPLDPLITGFMAWRTGEGMSQISTADASKMFREEFNIAVTSRRVNGKPQKYRVIDGPKQDMKYLLDTLKG